MKVFKFFFLFIFFVIILNSDFTAELRPLDIIKNSVKVSQDIINALPDNFTPEQEKAAIEKIRKELEPLLDQDKTCEVSISSDNWAKFTPPQKEEFKQSLKKILVQKFSGVYKKEKKTPVDPKAVTPPKSKKINIDIKQEQVYNDTLLQVPAAVMVTSIVPGDDIDLPLDFIFFQNAKMEWKLYDIHVDTKSVIFGYKKQFSTIIEKHDPAYLLLKLNESISKNEK